MKKLILGVIVAIVYGISYMKLLFRKIEVIDSKKIGSNSYTIVDWYTSFYNWNTMVMK